MRRLVPVLVVVLLLAGGVWLFRNTGGCAGARLDGILIEHPAGTLALQVDRADMIYPIHWPFWYGLRRLGDGRLAIADWFGLWDIKAAAGDHVGLPGGQAVDDPEAWGVYGIKDEMDTLRL